ncbi:MAG: hypothetical protein HOO91_05790 [Bacteroidales bacterium]|nr:hypothetical protein [Bacteroidales bacterium]
MNKKHLIYLLLGMLVLIGFNSKAQFDNINLNKYKLTDFRYKSLSTNLNFNNEGRYINSSTNSNQNNLSSNGGISYSSTSQSRKYYGNQNISFGFNNNYGKSEVSSINTYSSSSNSLYLSASINNKFYISDKNFFAINFSTYMSPSQSHSRQDNFTDVSKTLNNYFFANNMLSIQIGRGRYENVTDARLAIYILDDLVKQGRLSRSPNEDEVFELADFITKTLNKRVIDTRTKRIQEYVAVDSFLVSKGLTTKTDGLYFGIINDNWNYARSQSWQTGKSWFFGVSPILSYNNNFYKYTLNDLVISKQRHELTRYGIGFNAGFGSSWIKGLKWQEGYSLNGSFNIFKYDTVGSYSAINNYQSISGQASYFLSYIPNTRTVINFGSGIVLTKYFNVDTNDRIEITPNIAGSCNYYFSEKLRLQINANVNYNFNRMYAPISTIKTVDFGFRAALQYYIF